MSLRSRASEKRVNKTILHSWQEIKGSVESVKKDSNFIILTISCEKINEIQIPRESLINESVLTPEKIINHFVSILRTDNDYRIRDYGPTVNFYSSALSKEDEH